MVWTINEEENLRAELQSGVDGIITDDPKLALSLREQINASQYTAPIFAGQSQ